VVVICIVHQREADWDKVIGGNSFSVFMVVHTEDSADDRLMSGDHQSSPRHGTLPNPTRINAVILPWHTGALVHDTVSDLSTSESLPTRQPTGAGTRG